jgi:hypothetical protein
MMHEVGCAPAMHCCPLDQGGTRPILLALQESCSMQASCLACVFVAQPLRLFPSGAVAVAVHASVANAVKVYDC